MRAVPSSPAVSTRFPSGEKTAELTGPLCPLKVRISCPVFASQMRAVPSSPAVSTRFPSGEKTAELTGPLCPLKVRISCPVFASQMRAVPSSPAVSTLLPSEEKTAEVTEPSCPLRARISCPVFSSQMRAVPSSPAVSTCLSSEEKTAELTPELCPMWRNGSASGGRMHPGADGMTSGAVNRVRSAPSQSTSQRFERANRAAWQHAFVKDVLKHSVSTNTTPVRSAPWNKALSKFANLPETHLSDAPLKSAPAHLA